MSDEDPQAVWDRKHPKTATTPVQTPTPSQNTAPTPTIVDHSDPQTVWDAKHPKTAVPDTDLENMNPWEKPAATPWSDYAYAKAHKLGGALESAGSDWTRAFMDDYAYGTPDIARAAQTGQPIEQVRAETEAAKARLGASRYPVAIAAAVAPNPVGWLAKGSRIANAIEQPIAKVVGPLASKIISKATSGAVESGAYTAAQDIGHGKTADLPMDVTGSSLFGAGLSPLGDAIPAASKWARERWSGTPEASPSEITSATTASNAPGSSAQAANADQFEQWRNNIRALGKYPSQSEIETHANSLYKTPDQWPAEMKTLYKAAGGQDKTLVSRALSIAGSQIPAGMVTGGSYLLGAPLDPAAIAAIHGVAGYVGDQVAPQLNTAFGGSPTTSRAILDAYPALTGMRVAPNAPGAPNDWTKLVTGLANPSTPNREDITPGPYQFSQW